MADFTTARIDAIKNMVAAATDCVVSDFGCASVQTSGITVTVAAGSVKVTTRVPVQGSYDAVKVKDSLAQGIFKDIASLQSALTGAGVSGVTVESVAPTTMTPAGGGDGGGLSGGTVAGIIIGLLCAIGIGVGVAWYVYKKKQQGKTEEKTGAKTDAKHTKCRSICPTWMKRPTKSGTTPPPNAPVPKVQAQVTV